MHAASVPYDLQPCGAPPTAPGQHLAAKHLCASDVATFAPEIVFLDALKPEQVQQVVEYRMHYAAPTLAGISATTIDNDPRPADKYRVISGEK